MNNQVVSLSNTIFNNKTLINNIRNCNISNLVMVGVGQSNPLIGKEIMEANL